MSKRVLKLVGMLIILTLMSTTASFAASVPPDVKGAMYEEAVSTLVEKGIILGDTDGNFYPNSTLTRAQACIIVVKSMNPQPYEVTGTATQSAPKSGFKDMSGYGWAEGYIGYAVQKGVTKGYPDGSFKPGNSVTMNEFVTMVLRAAGYTDENLSGTWPMNYVGKAADLELYDLIPAPLPQLATKWMAAQFTYNALDKIEAANPAPETPGQGTDQDKPSAIPDTKNMTFANGSFNATITTYEGKAISKDVIVYTYGLSKDYTSTMTFSNKISDYRIDTVYKFKNVKTPAFYTMKNNEITAFVLPRDMGFSGRAYGVINGTVRTLNAHDEAVTALETLTATKEITWFAKKGLSAIPASSEYLDGEVYEMNTSGGEIQSIYRADQEHKAKLFNEISSNSAGFVKVKSFSDGVVQIDGENGALFEVRNNASVYVLSADDPTEYKAGSLSSIRAGVQVRAYDISDDDHLSADIIVVKK